MLPGSDAPLVYSFGLPFVSGTADATTATVGFGGTVTFAWPTRGIDIGFADAVVTLGPAADIVVPAFRRDRRRLGRVAGADARLEPGGRRRAQHQRPDPQTYERIPATLTTEGAIAFAGYYAAGDEYRTVSVTYTKGG